MFLIQYTGFPHATIIRIENIARLVYAPLKKEGTKAAFMALFGLQKNFAVRDFFSQNKSSFRNSKGCRKIKNKLVSVAFVLYSLQIRRGTWVGDPEARNKNFCR